MNHINRAAAPKLVLIKPNLQRCVVLKQLKATLQISFRYFHRKANPSVHCNKLSENQRWTRLKKVVDAFDLPNILCFY